MVLLAHPSFLAALEMYRGNISISVPWYSRSSPPSISKSSLAITRIQTGVRLDIRLLQLFDRLISEGLVPDGLGGLIEHLVLHDLAGPTAKAFDQSVLSRIAEVKGEIGMDYDFPDEGAGKVHDTGRHQTTPKILRTQAGFRIERSLLKVLKALAEKWDLTLGALIEDMAYHQLVGECSSGTEALHHICQLKEVYGMTYSVTDRERLVEHRD